VRHLIVHLPLCVLHYECRKLSTCYKCHKPNVHPYNVAEPKHVTSVANLMCVTISVINQVCIITNVPKDVHITTSAKMLVHVVANTSFIDEWTYGINGWAILVLIIWSCWQKWLVNGFSINKDLELEFYEGCVTSRNQPKCNHFVCNYMRLVVVYD
jgi:hypothetical protein